MIFSSASFFAFFIAVLALYAGARTKQQRAALLLVASLIFYASWKPAYLLLLGASLIVNFFLYRSLLEKRSRGVLIFGIVLNLLSLAVFKYLMLAWESALALGRYAGLTGAAHAPDWVKWALPLGISFYTFHMLSALIDVYRGHWAKPVSFARWCLYVTFFPHLIAGPILRPGQLIDQLGELQPVRLDALRQGAAIFFAGLIKKVLFADNLGLIADKLFAQPDALGFGLSWLAAVSFAFQIYFDFSGYSEMAIGLARIFGVSLPRNFLYPYISRSPSEFWRRWHITLSQWLRDYLYISLGGNRKGEVRTYFNLMATMFLGGLWHGANWTFAVWGIAHGLYLVGERMLRAGYQGLFGDRMPGLAKVVSLGGIPLTFVLVCFTWVCFRAPDFGDTWTILTAMLGLHQPTGSAPLIRSYEIATVAAAGVLVWAEPALVESKLAKDVSLWWRLPFPLRGLAYAALVLLLLILGGSTQKFIYFDF